MRLKLNFIDQPIPKTIRKHRRVLAALLAGLAVLTFGSSLSQSRAEPISNELTALIPTSKVAVAVSIGTELTKSWFHPGRKIDLVASINGSTAIVARNAEVISIGGSSSFLGNQNQEVLVAINEFEVLGVTAAIHDQKLTAIIKPN
jgi:hypothetical protein